MAAVRQQKHPAPGSKQAPAPTTQQQQAHFSRALQRPLPPEPLAPSMPSQAQAAFASKQGLAGGSLPPSIPQQPAASTQPQPSSARKRTKQDVAQQRQGVLAAQDASDQDPADSRGDKRQKGAAGQDTSALGSAGAPISVTDSDDEDRPLCSFANFNAFQRPTGHAMAGRPGTVPAGSNGFPATTQLPAGQRARHVPASGSIGHLGGQMAMAQGRQPSAAAGPSSTPERGSPMVWSSIKAKALARPAPAPERAPAAPQQQTNRAPDQGQAGSSMPTPPRTNPSPSAPPWAARPPEGLPSKRVKLDSASPPSLAGAAGQAQPSAPALSRPQLSAASRQAGPAAAGRQPELGGLGKQAGPAAAGLGRSSAVAGTAARAQRAQQLGQRPTQPVPIRRDLQGAAQAGLPPGSPMDIDAGPLVGPSRNGVNVRRANITSGTTRLRPAGTQAASAAQAAPEQQPQAQPSQQSRPAQHAQQPDRPTGALKRPLGGLGGAEEGSQAKRQAVHPALRPTSPPQASAANGVRPGVFSWAAPAQRPPDAHAKAGPLNGHAVASAAAQAPVAKHVGSGAFPTSPGAGKGGAPVRMATPKLAARPSPGAATTPAARAATPSRLSMPPLSTPPSNGSHLNKRDMAAMRSVLSGLGREAPKRVATSSPALTPQQLPRETKRRRLGTPSASSSPLRTNGIHVDLTSSEAEDGDPSAAAQPAPGQDADQEATSPPTTTGHTGHPSGQLDVPVDLPDLSPGGEPAENGTAGRVTSDMRAAARGTEEWQAAELAEWTARKAEIAAQAEAAQRAKRAARAAAEEQERVRLRLEEHRLEQQKQQDQVTSKALLCQRAREALQRKIGVRKDPFSILLALRIPMPADNQPRNVKVAEAFKKARRQWHPDRHRHATLEQQAHAEEMFKLLSFHAPK